MDCIFDCERITTATTTTNVDQSKQFINVSCEDIKALINRVKRLEEIIDKYDFKDYTEDEEDSDEEMDY